MKQTLCRAQHQVDRFRTALARRPHVPGEHWLALATGIGLWLATRGHPSLAVRLGGAIGGSLLLTKTALGREGLSRVLEHVPFRSPLPQRHRP